MYTSSKCGCNKLQRFIEKYQTEPQMFFDEGVTDKVQKPSAANERSQLVVTHRKRFDFPSKSDIPKKKLMWCSNEKSFYLLAKMKVAIEWSLYNLIQFTLYYLTMTMISDQHISKRRKGRVYEGRDATFWTSHLKSRQKTELIFWRQSIERELYYLCMTNAAVTKTQLVMK